MHHKYCVAYLFYHFCFTYIIKGVVGGGGVSFSDSFTSVFSSILPSVLSVSKIVVLKGRELAGSVGRPHLLVFQMRDKRA